MNLEDGLRPGGADCKGIRRGVKKKKKIRCTDMNVTFSLKCCPFCFLRFKGRIFANVSSSSLEELLSVGSSVSSSSSVLSSLDSLLPLNAPLLLFELRRRSFQGLLGRCLRSRVIFNSFDAFTELLFRNIIKFGIFLDGNFQSILQFEVLSTNSCQDLHWDRQMYCLCRFRDTVHN